MNRYSLEIYPPNNIYDSIVKIESDAAFLTISVGDLISTWDWEPDQIGLEGKFLKVVLIQHRVARQLNDQGIDHHLNIFTVAVPSDLEAMLKRISETT